METPAFNSREMLFKLKGLDRWVHEERESWFEEQARRTREEHQRAAAAERKRVNEAHLKERAMREEEERQEEERLKEERRRAKEQAEVRLRQQARNRQTQMHSKLGAGPAVTALRAVAPDHAYVTAGTCTPLEGEPRMHAVLRAVLDATQELEVSGQLYGLLSVDSSDDSSSSDEDDGVKTSFRASHLVVRRLRRRQRFAADHVHCDIDHDARRALLAFVRTDSAQRVRAYAFDGEHAMTLEPFDEGAMGWVLTNDAHDRFVGLVFTGRQYNDRYDFDGYSSGYGSD